MHRCSAFLRHALSNSPIHSASQKPHVQHSLYLLQQSILSPNRLYKGIETPRGSPTRLRRQQPPPHSNTIHYDHSFMMQSRRLDHGSSGELDVFGATSYFAGGGLLPDDDDRCVVATVEPPSPTADRRDHLFQAKVLVQRDTTTEGRRSSPRRHVVVPQRQLGLGVQHQHVVVAKQPSGKSKLAALLSFMVSPSPRTSFRKEAAPSPTRQQLPAAAAAAGDEPAACDNYKAVSSPLSSPRESSMRLLQGLFGAHGYDDDDDLDLGVATGDRRLQGIRVVRGGGGGEERWVVRCVRGAWDEEEKCRDREKMLGMAESSSSDEKNKQGEVEEGDDDDDGNREGDQCWDSDSSSDLFDLNLEYMCADDLPSTT